MSCANFKEIIFWVCTYHYPSQRRHLLYLTRQGSQLPLQQIKETTIAKIELTTEQLTELKRALQSKIMGPWTKETKQRKLIGICQRGALPDYIVTRYYQDAKVIEKYCTDCLSKEQDKGSLETYVVVCKR